MKTPLKLLLVVSVFYSSLFNAFAQDTSPADLIKQGIGLSNQGKYADAIAKYNEALKADPQNEYAHYQIAFSLFALKKAQEAIPHLDIAVKSQKTSLAVAAYCLLANIYDDAKQSQKAIDTYNTAIKIDPEYPQIYYNLGLAYFKAQQYAEAETNLIEAIKHNPKNTTNQRLYALAAFHQNKRANALLGLCSFLLAEPSGPRSAEAYGNIKHILQGGILTDNNGKAAPTVVDKETNALNQCIAQAIQSGKGKNLSGTALLEYQLKSIFTAVGELSAKKTEKTFFDHFMADYFYKLAQSSNMPAFIHTITLTDAAANSAQWQKEHTQQVTNLADWLKNTERTF